MTPESLMTIAPKDLVSVYCCCVQVQAQAHGLYPRGRNAAEINLWKPTLGGLGSERKPLHDATYDRQQDSTTSSNPRTGFIGVKSCEEPSLMFNIGRREISEDLQNVMW